MGSSRISLARINLREIREFTFLVTEIFRSAAEAGPLDIVKLRKGDKLLNISTNLPLNTPDTPYVLQVSKLYVYTLSVDIQ